MVGLIIGVLGVGYAVSLVAFVVAVHNAKKEQEKYRN